MKAYDATVELQVLKTILDSQNRNQVLSQLTPEHFGSDAAKEVYHRVIHLIQLGKSPPSSEVFKNDGSLSQAAQAFIGSTNARPLSTHEDTEAALDILGKYRKGRLLLSSITDAVSNLKNDDPDIDSVISNITDTLQRCHSGSRRQEMLHISADNADNLLKKFDSNFDSPPNDIIPTGFRVFDKNTGGFRKKNVIVLASVPGGGKSAMAEQMAINQFMMGYNVCFCSWEMDEQELLDRMWACVSSMNHTDINLKRLNQKSKKHVRDKFEEFIKCSGMKNRLTLFCPEREMNIPEISLEIKAANYDIVYIDYIGLLKQDPKKQMWESLGDHARSAKLMANNINIAAVLLAQFDDESNKIKYSKAIQANAHFVWAWERGEGDIVKINQLKARNAEVYEFQLQRDFKTMTFKDFDSSSIPMTDPKALEKKQNEIPKMPGLSTA